MSYLSATDKRGFKTGTASRAGAALALSIALSCFAPGPARAQAPAADSSYPSKPVRIVVAFSPGGATDIVTRIVAERLTPALGQTFMVENRPGASGLIGTDLVAKAIPDGYTLTAQSTTSFTYAVHVFGAKLPYDPVKDFTPICRVVAFPMVVVVNPNVPVKSLKELVDYLKRNPGKLSYASFGLGSTAHVAAELFKHMSGTEMQHVPYKGSGQAHPDLIGGHVQVMFDTAMASMGHIRSGKLRALAVTGSRRLRMLPEVPTTGEEGMPGLVIGSWIGIVGPAGMAPAVVARLSQAMIKAAQLPDAQQKFAELGAEVVAEPPDQFAAFIKDEIASFGKLVKDAGLRFE